MKSKLLIAIARFFRFLGSDAHWNLFGRTIALLFVTCLLLMPAVWNGYPLIFFDSQDYVEMSFTLQPITYRTLPYGIFVAIARLFDTLWAVIIAQALIVSWTIRETVFAFVNHCQNLVFVFCGVLLATLTGLAIVNSVLMPDVFAATAILGIAIFAFGKTLPLWRNMILLVIVVISIAVHMSHVAIATGLMFLILSMAIVACWFRRMPKPGLRLCLLACLTGIMAVPVSHWLSTDRFYFSDTGQIRMLALSIQNGLAKKYLDEVCPQGAKLKLCNYRNQLPVTADTFLWGKSPFNTLGGWELMHDEANVIVKDIVKLFPVAVAVAMLKNTGEQLTLMADGDQLQPLIWHFNKIQQQYYPHETPYFDLSRQQQESGIDFQTINRLHVPLAVLFMFVICVVLIVAWRQNDNVAVGLIVLIVIALLGNAYVCGALSNPHDRYQNRIAWLTMFVSILVSVRLLQRKRIDKV